MPFIFPSSPSPLSPTSFHPSVQPLPRPLNHPSLYLPTLYASTRPPSIRTSTQCTIQPPRRGSSDHCGVHLISTLPLSPSTLPSSHRAVQLPGCESQNLNQLPDFSTVLCAFRTKKPLSWTEQEKLGVLRGVDRCLRSCRGSSRGAALIE